MLAWCNGFALFFFFKQKTAYEMRISDWSSDVCSSDLSVANGSLSWSATWVPHAGCLSGEGAAPGVRHEPALEAEPVGQPESDGCLVSRSAVFDQRCAGGVSGEPVIACQNRARDAPRKGDVGAPVDAGGPQAALCRPEAGRVGNTCVSTCCSR